MFSDATSGRCASAGRTRSATIIVGAPPVVSFTLRSERRLIDLRNGSNASGGLVRPARLRAARLKVHDGVGDLLLRLMAGLFPASGFGLRACHCPRSRPAFALWLAVVARLLRASANPLLVSISSVAGRCGFALRSACAAAKWGVIAFNRSLSIELCPDGVRVNAILPGLVAGDRQRRVMEAKAQRLGVSFAEIEEKAFS